jgi:multicomponent Na+:H+ antiporter subunit C
MAPPLVDQGARALAADAANPLPQALILTAIVIGFGLAVFTLVLLRSAHSAFGTVIADEMHEAEKLDAAAPLPAVAPDPAAPPHRREAA